MRACFHRSGVIAGRQNDSADAVHDALVVGGCPVRVDRRKGVGVDHAFDDLLAAALLGLQNLRR